MKTFLFVAVSFLISSTLYAGDVTVTFGGAQAQRLQGLKIDTDTVVASCADGFCSFWLSGVEAAESERLCPSCEFTKVRRWGYVTNKDQIRRTMTLLGRQPGAWNRDDGSVWKVRFKKSMLQIDCLQYNEAQELYCDFKVRRKSL